MGRGLDLQGEPAEHDGEDEIDERRIQHREQRVLQVEQRGAHRLLGGAQREHPFHHGKENEADGDGDAALDDRVNTLFQDGKQLIH